MSKCISWDGEYGSHTLDGEGFYCVRCGCLDESALMERLRAAEAVCADMWRNRSLMTNSRGHTSDIGRALDAWHEMAHPEPVAGEAEA